MQDANKQLSISWSTSMKQISRFTSEKRLRIKKRLRKLRSVSTSRCRA